MVKNPIEQKRIKIHNFSRDSYVKKTNKINLEVDNKKYVSTRDDIVINLNNPSSSIKNIFPSPTKSSNSLLIPRNCPIKSSLSFVYKRKTPVQNKAKIQENKVKNVAKVNLIEEFDKFDNKHEFISYIFSALILNNFNGSFLFNKL